MTRPTDRVPGSPGALDGYPPLVVPGEIVRVTDLPDRSHGIPTRAQMRYQQQRHGLPAASYVRNCDLPGTKRRWIRRAVDDPFWVLMGGIGGIGLAILGTLAYGILTTVAYLGPIPTLIVACLMLLGITSLVAKIRGTTHRCTGLHCSGCRG